MLQGSTFGQIYINNGSHDSHDEKSRHAELMDFRVAKTDLAEKVFAVLDNLSQERKHKLVSIGNRDSSYNMNKRTKA